MNVYMKDKRASESFQTPIQSPQFKQKKKRYMNVHMREKRASESFQTPTQSPQFKQKKKQYMNVYMKERQASEGFQSLIQCHESKQKKRWYMKEYWERKHFQCEPLQNLIAKFHNVVSQGPLYICTCCDQLWYKHSVIPAAALKKNNPSVQNKLK